MGLGLHDALKHAAPGLPPERYPDLGRRYRHHYFARQHELVLFPGTLEMLLRQGPPQAVVVHADWPRVARASPTGSTPPLLQELAGDDGAQAAASAEWLAFVERLKSVTAGERKPLMVTHFRAQVARVLGLKSADDIDARTPLVDLGLDSLMAVELANQLRASTGAYSLCPLDLSPPPPGSCTECVASNTTGQPVSRITASERMSATRLL